MSEKNLGGRPPELTPELHKAIVADIADAIPYEYAAGANGISEKTLYNWKNRGKEDQEAGLDTPFSQFLQDIKKAECNRIREHNVNLRSHVKDWAADAWMLERRWWKHYSKSVPLIDMQRSLNEMALAMEKDNGKS